MHSHTRRARRVAILTGTTTHVSHRQLEVRGGDEGHGVDLLHLIQTLGSAGLLAQAAALDVRFDALTNGQLDRTLANLCQVRTRELLRVLGQVVLSIYMTAHRVTPRRGATAQQIATHDCLPSSRTRSTSLDSGDFRSTAFRIDRRDGLSGMGMKIS